MFQQWWGKFTEPEKFDHSIFRKKNRHQIHNVKINLVNVRIWQTRKVQWKTSILFVSCVIFYFTWKCVVVFLCICSDDDGEKEEDLQEMHIIWNTKWMSKCALWTNICSVTFENYCFQIKRIFGKGQFKVDLIA